MGTGAIDPDAQPATEAEVFAAKAESFENTGEGLMLSLPVRIAHGEQLGRLRYEVLDIMDEAGAPLDITPHTGPVYAYPDCGKDRGVFLAGAIVTPDKIGPYPAFSDYGRVRARASFFTSRLYRMRRDLREACKAGLRSRYTQAQDKGRMCCATKPRRMIS